MDSPGRPPVTIDLSVAGSEKTLKDKPFRIKEGSKFTMSATFRVQHEVLSGLQYVQVVKRKGMKVSTDKEMIVRFFFFFPVPFYPSPGRELTYPPPPHRAPTHPARTSSLCTPRNVRIPLPPPPPFSPLHVVLSLYKFLTPLPPFPPVQEEEAPSGMLARGHYNAISSFVDDDKKEHLKFEWSFDIAKDWE